MRARSTSSTSSWSVHRSSETMRLAGHASARPASAPAAHASAAAASPMLARTAAPCRCRLLFRPSGADALRAAERQLEPRVGRKRRRFEAEHLLIVPIERILNAREHLHARLQLVGDRRIDQPVGVERHALRREEERTSWNAMSSMAAVVDGGKCRRASPAVEGVGKVRAAGVRRPADLALAVRLAGVGIGVGAAQRQAAGDLDARRDLDALARALARQVDGREGEGEGPRRRAVDLVRQVGAEIGDVEDRRAP